MATEVLTERPLELLEATICQGSANLTAAEHEWLLAVQESAGDHAHRAAGERVGVGGDGPCWQRV